MSGYKRTSVGVPPFALALSSLSLFHLCVETLALPYISAWHVMCWLHSFCTFCPHLAPPPSPLSGEVGSRGTWSFCLSRAAELCHRSPHGSKRELSKTIKSSLPIPFHNERRVTVQTACVMRAELRVFFAQGHAHCCWPLVVAPLPETAVAGSFAAAPPPGPSMS